MQCRAVSCDPHVTGGLLRACPTLKGVHRPFVSGNPVRGHVGINPDEAGHYPDAVDIRVVTSGRDLDAVRDLFREYAAQVGIDLSFQGFSSELTELPGDYTAPGGT